MEDLNKTQIVLLCLFVSFVTSIGTGIITTSLLQEAPQNVTQTINRVVERTVETIVPQPTGVTTREVTVVVKEEDLVIDAISKNRGSLVRIFERSAQAAPRSLGVVVNSDGLIMADKNSVSSNGSYNAVFADGRVYPLEFHSRSGDTQAVFMKILIDNNAVSTFTPVSIGNSDSLQLGQTVIAVGGKEREQVSIGRITAANRAVVDENATTTQAVSEIESDSALRDSFAGSILLNLSGDVVGFENSDAGFSGENSYTAINIIRRDQPSVFQVQTN